MNSIFLNSKLSDDERRARLYQGQVFLYSASPATQRFVVLAKEMIHEAFPGVDPSRVQDTMPVEQCVEILATLKPRFIHDPRSKQCIRDLLVERGCDPERTYFDVPRMRTAFPSDYLTSGIAYAFHPHRDTWYSAPQCQLNWWFPIFDVTEDNVMAFHPHYWSHPVKNSSRGYNYYEWNAQSRKVATQQIKSDTRVQPKAEEPVELDPQVRVVAEPGGMMIFSGAQLHSTVPNRSPFTRFSIDFRTVHLDDARLRRGAPNIDSQCTGTTMRDYLRVTDLARLPEEVIALYDDGTESSGELIYHANLEAAGSQ